MSTGSALSRGGGVWTRGWKIAAGLLALIAVIAVIGSVTGGGSETSERPPPKPPSTPGQAQASRETNPVSAPPPPRPPPALPPPPAPAPLPPLPAPPPQTQGKTDTLLWFQGGTLHQKTAADWVKAPHRERLATAADYAIAVLKDTIVWDAISDVDQVRPYAEDLVECIDEAYGTKPILPTMANSGTAAFCWPLMYPNPLK